MPSYKVLVTGATGLVGSYFIRQAVEAGCDVHAMVRPSSDRSILAGLPVSFVEADLSRPESLPPALDGAEVVVHCAAHVGDWGPAELYRAINVVALEHMLLAVEKQDSFKRWIQISSMGSYPARHHYGTDETTPLDVVGLDGYTQTKAESDNLVRQHCREHGLPAVVLRPGFIYGPGGDRHALSRVVDKIRTGKMKVIGDGSKVLNNTYVGNLIDAILLAIEKPDIAGEAFNIRDERLVTREELIRTICEYLGKPYPRKVPERFARRIVKPIEWFARLRGKKTPPLLTNAQIKFMTLNLDFSIAKAKKELGYQPRVDFRDGIRIALDDITGTASATPAPSAV